VEQAEVIVLWDRARRVVTRADIQRKAGAKVPVDRYVDPARLDHERALLRSWPQVACAASSVRLAGDWLATELLGVPLLVIRGDDGELRAFLNVCRHRGVAVAQGCGRGRSRFVCPYHSWTYDCLGSLVGRPQDADFPHMPATRASLVPVPVSTRCGLVWVVPSSNDGFDWDAYFGPMAKTLEGLGYDDSSECPDRRAFVHPANWKLLVDGALETYHFQYAHRRTIAPHFHDDAVQQETFGPHQRIVMPRRSLAEAGVRPEDPTPEQFGRHASLLNFFFPSSFLLWNGDHMSVFVMRPHTTDTAETDSFMIVPPALHASRPKEHWDLNWQRLWNPLLEDYELSASIQRGLRSGANTELVFGSNEFAGPQFHATLEAFLDLGFGPLGS
jgi:choline monooxygenase